ncbi:MAG TPA: cyclase family protein [Thermomicrobiales bacterium]|jgi:kynurenine formamidase
MATDGTETDSTLGNWGRWGDGDERGTLNLLTAERVAGAAGLVRRGKVYSLAVPLAPDAPAGRRYPVRHHAAVFAKPGDPYGWADDRIELYTHGTTHIDALSHIFYDNRFYNGYRVDESFDPRRGAVKNGMHNASALVGRGVLLDVAGHRGVEHLGLNEEIAPEELDACARAQGVAIQAGDVVLIRTGWLRVFAADRALFEAGEPGPGGRAGAWFRAHDLCAVGADNRAVETLAFPAATPWPLHVEVVRNLGGYLMELLDLEGIAADKVYEFLFVGAPLPLVGGIGSPLNPLAIC